MYQKAESLDFKITFEKLSKTLRKFECLKKISINYEKIFVKIILIKLFISILKIISFKKISKNFKKLLKQSGN